jgi:glycosyltransferase involved in cell wall biosynthesis
MIRVLCLHLPEQQASYRYRVEQFQPYWEQYGIEMSCVCIVGKNYYEKLILALKGRHYDYVWLQKKPLSPFIINLITSRSRLVYDYDDALYARQSGRTGRVTSTHAGSPHLVSRINYILSQSSLVFAGSETLYHYAARFNPDRVHLVPTAYCGSVELFTDMDRSGEVTVGWIGGNHNMVYLRLVDEATSFLQQRYPFLRFSIMSGRPPEGLRTVWDFVPWSLEAEQAWLRSIDIGIMPLDDDEWCRGKCAFKLLQYMAYGKPVVASSVGENCRAVIHGRSGYLASTSGEWMDYLALLLDDGDRRALFGAEGRRLLLANYDREVVQKSIAGLLTGCSF